MGILLFHSLMLPPVRLLNVVTVLVVSGPIWSVGFHIVLQWNEAHSAQQGKICADAIHG